MTSRWHWNILQLTRQLWIRATLFSVLAVLTAFAALLFRPYLPEGLETRIGADAVDGILNIIAASMLTVTTFSLTTMVSAYAAVTTSVTPRATTLLMADTTTQNVLATFIGSFLYSLVGIVALSIGVYGDEGRVVLFVVTIGVILLIVGTLLRWIDHLSRLGRVNETTRVVENATAMAMRDRHERPFLGGTPLRDAQTTATADRTVGPNKIGFVQHVDMAILQRLAEERGTTIRLCALPGAFVDRTSALVALSGKSDLEDGEVRAAFTVGDERSFDQDPRFGLAVMAEIASRALSPAVNDPGTAMDVVSRAVRVLAIWAESKVDDAVVNYPAVHVPAISIDECFDDVFTPIARDGAAMVEVQVRIQKALLSLARMGGDAFGKNARRHARLALQRAELAMPIEADRALVRHHASLVDSSLA